MPRAIEELFSTVDLSADLLVRIAGTSPDGHRTEFKVTQEGVIFDVFAEGDDSEEVCFSWAATWEELVELTN